MDRSRATPPQLFSFGSPSPARVKFAAVLAHWTGPAVEPALRWEADMAQALSWFATIEAEAADVNLLQVLTEWHDWLLGQHSARQRDTRKAFVRDWRKSFREAIRRSTPRPTPAAETKPAPARRGGYGGARQDFELTTIGGEGDSDADLKW